MDEHSLNTNKKGVKMHDDFDRDHVVKELKEIRDKLLQLSTAQEEAADLKENLSSLAERLGQLIAAGGDTPSMQPTMTDAKMILVVDDNEETREFIKQALLMTGYQVLEASSGEDALTTAKETPDIDLVISDVMLPGIKGPELVDRLHEMDANIKAIFISGYIEEDVVSQDVDNIIDPSITFLQKPLSYRVMLGKIEEMLGS
jgi:CheY-like chemotaxis protein